MRGVELNNPFTEIEFRALASLKVSCVFGRSIHYWLQNLLYLATENCADFVRIFLYWYRYNSCWKIEFARSKMSLLWHTACITMCNHEKIRLTATVARQREINRSALTTQGTYGHLKMVNTGTQLRWVSWEYRPWRIILIVRNSQFSVTPCTVTRKKYHFHC